MPGFELPLPPELGRPAPLEGLSPEARTALSRTAIGPTAAEQLLAGLTPTAENYVKEAKLEQAAVELDAFAARLFPGEEEADEETRKNFTGGFKVEWDDEQNEAEIWPINPETGERIPYSLDLKHRGLSGELRLPSNLRILGLDCSHNELTAIANLPEGLERLDCADNQLITLPALPEALRRLDCSRNRLTLMPHMPEHLTWLYCRQNKITKISSMNPFLEELDCAENNLQYLPSASPELRTLDCSSNELTVLRGLYHSLTNLICSGNKLTELQKALPLSLETLKCDNNKLTKLPALPDGLRELNVAHNQLTKLPAIPSSVKTLVSWDNPWRFRTRRMLANQGTSVH